MLESYEQVADKELPGWTVYERLEARTIQ
jgi:hypothetical protein